MGTLFLAQSTSNRSPLTLVATSKTDDYLWALVFAKAPGTITIASGSNSKVFNVAAGVSKLQVPQAPGGVSATFVRSGQTVYRFAPGGFTFTASPSSYNFNAHVAAGP